MVQIGFLVATKHFHREKQTSCKLQQPVNMNPFWAQCIFMLVKILATGPGCCLMLSAYWGMPFPNKEQGIKSWDKRVYRSWCWLLSYTFIITWCSVFLVALSPTMQQWGAGAWKFCIIYLNINHIFAMRLALNYINVFVLWPTAPLDLNGIFGLKANR